MLPDISTYMAAHSSTLPPSTLNDIDFCSDSDICYISHSVVPAISILNGFFCGK